MNDTYLSLRRKTNTQKFTFQHLHTNNRVDMVGTNHDELLTQWRHYPMGKFSANIFLIKTTSGPQKISKIRVLLVNYFHLSRKKYLKLKSWLNLDAISVFLLIRLKIYVNFRKKNLKKWPLNHVAWYTNQFSHWKTTKIS
jgi:hypothetical protein